MNELLNISFRNVFRHKNRSLITVIMALLAVMAVVVSSSFLTGIVNSMIEEMARYTGHVRINSTNYDIKQRTMSLEGNVSGYTKLKTVLTDVNEIQTIAGRLKFGSLVFKGDDSKAVVGYGVEQSDLKTLKLKETISQGRAINLAAKDEIEVGQEVADSLKLQIGDEVTLLVRTLYNSNWALNFKVVGIYDTGNPYQNRLFYISLPTAQYLLDMKDRVNEIALFGSSPNATHLILEHLKKVKSLANLQLKRWDEIGMGPILVGMYNMIIALVQLIFIILAGLGIANTIMMAIIERKSEIGLLKSMGMHENEIVGLFTMEGTFLGLIGTFIGLVIGGYFAYIMATHGINMGDRFKGLPVTMASVIYGGFNLGIFIKGLLMGVAASILASVIPILKGVRLTPSEALRR